MRNELGISVFCAISHSLCVSKEAYLKHTTLLHSLSVLKLVYSIILCKIPGKATNLVLIVCILMEHTPFQLQVRSWLYPVA